MFIGIFTPHAMLFSLTCSLVVSNKQIMEDLKRKSSLCYLIVASPRAPFTQSVPPPPTQQIHTALTTSAAPTPPPSDGMDLDLNFTSLKAGLLSWWGGFSYFRASDI